MIAGIPGFCSPDSRSVWVKRNGESCYWKTPPHNQTPDETCASLCLAQGEQCRFSAESTFATATRSS
jgi:hypothetical protein